MYGALCSNKEAEQVVFPSRSLYILRLQLSPFQPSLASGPTTDATSHINYYTIALLEFRILGAQYDPGMSKLLIIQPQSWHARSLGYPIVRSGVGENRGSRPCAGCPLPLCDAIIDRLDSRKRPLAVIPFASFALRILFDILHDSSKEGSVTCRCHKPSISQSPYANAPHSSHSVDFNLHGNRNADPVLGQQVVNPSLRRVPAKQFASAGAGPLRLFPIRKLTARSRGISWKAKIKTHSSSFGYKLFPG